jgi:hypothetical protein
MRLRLATLCLTAALALCLTACGDDEATSVTTPEPAWEAAGSDEYILGSWAGVLRQEGMPDFRVRANVASLDDQAANRVFYTGIECGGTWAYLGFEGTVYRFRETIDRGAGGACKGVGTVTLLPAGQDAVGYEFRGGGVVSRGLLRRTSAP